MEIVADATDATSVFVYFWEQGIERLVLQIVTLVDVDQGLERTQIKLGEGITGWSAQNRRSVIITEEIQKDPRHVILEGISEDRYHSMIAVPIVNGDDLYGVFALYSDRRFAFSADELAIAEEVGGLLASGLERAENIHNTQIQSATARFLLEFPVSAMTSRVTALQEGARRTLELLDADACVIDYVPWLGANPDPVVIAERDAGLSEPRVWLTHSKQLVRQRIEQFKFANNDSISVAIGFGASRGVLSCYKGQRFTAGEVERLNSLGTQLGILMESVESTSHGTSSLIRVMTSTSETEVEASLRVLGWKGGSILPILVQIEKASDNINLFIENVRERFTATAYKEVVIVGSGTTMLILVEVSAQKSYNEMLDFVQNLLREVASDLGLFINVGIGKISNKENAAYFAISQAKLALRWSGFIGIHSPVNISKYDEIQDVLELPELISERAQRIGIIRRNLTPLIKYDAEHGTQLLETLRVFASHGGSMVHASAELYIHRNTLRQRLSRIERLMGSSLLATADWIEIILATQLQEL